MDAGLFKILVLVTLSFLIARRGLRWRLGLRGLSVNTGSMRRRRPRHPGWRVGPFGGGWGRTRVGPFGRW